MTVKQNSLQEAAAEILKASVANGYSDPPKAIKDPKENDTGAAVTKNTDPEKDYGKSVSKDTSEPTKTAEGNSKESMKKLPEKDRAVTKKGRNPEVDNDGIQKEDLEVTLEDVFKEFISILGENVDWQSTPEATLETFLEYVEENFESAELTEEDMSYLLENYFMINEDDDEDDDDEDDDDEDDDEDDDDEDDDKDEDDEKDVKESVHDRLRSALDEKIEIDVSEDIKAMFSGQELSEEFVERAKTIFEAAVRSKVRDIQEGMLEVYDSILHEEVESLEESYDHQINDFLNIVIKEWKEENEVAIENNLRNELTEEFISGLRNLFIEHYIDVPEEKLDVISGLSEQIDTLKDELNEQIAQSVELYKYTTELEKNLTFKDIVSESNLTLSQIEKLKSLAEDLDYDGAESYTKKIRSLIEGYWPENKTEESKYSSSMLGDDDNGENVVTEEVNTEVDRIAKALSRKLPK